MVVIFDSYHWIFNNKVIPSFTRQERSQGGLFPEVSPVGNDVLRLRYRTFHPWQTSAIQCPRLVETVENESRGAVSGFPFGGAGAQSPPSVLPGGVMPMTSSWGRLGNVQLARAESGVVLQRCRIGKRSAGILSVKQQMGPEKIETWGTHGNP